MHPTDAHQIVKERMSFFEQLCREEVEIRYSLQILFRLAVYNNSAQAVYSSKSSTNVDDIAATVLIYLIITRHLFNIFDIVRSLCITTPLRESHPPPKPKRTFMHTFDDIRVEVIVDNGELADRYMASIVMCDRFLFTSDHEMIIVIVLRLRDNPVYNENANNMSIRDPKLMRQTDL
ncbi:unnamed protein product [Angiostrongylus costaricensis]|uniref:Reverse transcriptase domain-containing protein n=1 Tax=Angiostrongylus costaricensis TaxID=334426 RepID=A0A0R3PU57_ANGCS|nr:unnamed protein product [Angiostrongylus costaricensis]